MGRARFSRFMDFLSFLILEKVGNLAARERFGIDRGAIDRHVCQSLSRSIRIGVAAKAKIFRICVFGEGDGSVERCARRRHGCRKEARKASAQQAKVPSIGKEILFFSSFSPLFIIRWGEFTILIIA